MEFDEIVFYDLTRIRVPIQITEEELNEELDPRFIRCKKIKTLCNLETQNSTEFPSKVSLQAAALTCINFMGYWEDVLIYISQTNYGDMTLDLPDVFLSEEDIEVIENTEGILYLGEDITLPTPPEDFRKKLKQEVLRVVLNSIYFEREDSERVV